MIPVDQTGFGEIDGNCWGAAIASVLEVGLDALPDYVADYHAGGDWHALMMAYLHRHHGLTLMSLDGRLIPHVTPNGFHLIGGLGPRGFQHSVVGLHGKIVHDPHPSRAGLVRSEEFEFLVPVNLDAIEDPEHRSAMERWLTRRDCTCRECGGAR